MRKAIRFFLFFIAPLLSLVMIISGDWRVLGYISFGALFAYHAYLGENYRGEKRILGLSPRWFGQKSHRKSDD